MCRQREREIRNIIGKARNVEGSIHTEHSKERALLSPNELRRIPGVIACAGQVLYTLHIATWGGVLRDFVLNSHHCGPQRVDLSSAS